MAGFRRLRCLLAVLKFRALSRLILLARLLPFPASFDDMASNVANPASGALVPTLFRVVIASITTMANTLFNSAIPGSEPPTFGCLHGPRCLRCLSVVECVITSESLTNRACVHRANTKSTFRPLCPVNVLSTCRRRSWGLLDSLSWVLEDDRTAHANTQRFATFVLYSVWINGTIRTPFRWGCVLYH